MAVIAFIRFIKRLSRTFCPLLLCAMLLSFWGCLAIYNASLQFSDPQYYVLKQVIWLFGGIAVALLLYRISAEWLFSFIPWFYALGLGALLLVLFAEKPHNGMRGWFHTGWFSIQPSEFCKPSLSSACTAPD